MMFDDQKTLRIELCKRWPKKFDKDDLDYWCRQLKPYPLKDITDVLTTFKNTKPFRPKIKEIIAMLPGAPVSAEQKQASAEAPFSTIVRRQMTGIQGELKPAETIMRYWRSVWWRYKEDFERRRKMTDAAAPIAAAKDGVTEAAYRARPAFVAMTALANAQIAGKLRKCTVSCECCLAIEGVPLEQCPDYAEWLDTSPEQFKMFLDTLDPVVDVLSL